MDLYKIKLIIPFPHEWLITRELIEGMRGHYVPAAALNNSVAAVMLDSKIDCFKQHKWAQDHALDWSLAVYDEFIVARNELGDRGQRLLNYYDNSDPMTGTRGSITIVCDDRDTALLFKLSL